MYRYKLVFLLPPRVAFTFVPACRWACVSREYHRPPPEMQHSSKVSFQSPRL